MTVTHWVTNKGKKLYGDGVVVGAADLYLGLILSSGGPPGVPPVGIDTEGEFQDVNFVSDLLAIANVDEPVGGWYARQTLSAPSNTEDDTNNRANVDVTDETFTAATAGEYIAGFFIAKDLGADSADPVISGGTIDPPIPTNGSDIAAQFADIYRVV